ncbi:MULTISPECIES: response regulator [Moraxella]|uniref:DNA-binding response regulator n=1 Tax=Moraxella lacunata TaxID=477 RepID=A0A1B8Q4I2_MORLA|nr:MULTISPECIES: response regulator [Moraxella]MBE9579560.1 response regulator [Moraxella sp. K1664]MBE9589095.1 response regulator [Moraxella sp. K1630]MBE9591667.1 response regulator [Moraxella sp. K127]MBE9597591.1 response regulator [Moraxella sp. K2450]MDH9219846.1 response regulator [Moraxella lacunata]
MTIKVLIVDDHELVRTGISRMLGDDPEIEVVGEAGCGETAVAMTRKLAPDVVLLDVNMPNIGGVEATRRIKQLDECIKVVVVSSLVAEPYPSMLLKAGVDGYITKGTPIGEMIVAIKKVKAGGKYFSHEIADVLAQNMLDKKTNPFDGLSEREKQVAMMVANCQSASQIADSLFVSVKTVNTYRYRIFEKLGVDSDVKLTHLAIRHGLVNT